MKIYFSVSEYDGDPEIREISLHPLNNCCIYDLQNLKNTIDLYYLDWDDFTPYNGNFINYNELYHSMDEKTFIKGPVTSDIIDWSLYDDYYKMGVYKEGKLLEVKYKKLNY